MAAPLTRAALARVLESLLRSELAAASPGAWPGGAAAGPVAWTEDLPLGEEGAGSLGCDSLDRMRLAAATNEMFHLHEVDGENALLEEPRFGAWLDAIEAAWRAGVSRVTFTTSGSTGRPKRWAHEFAFLAAEIGFLRECFAGRRRVVLLAPPHHIYGFLFGAMLPEALGVEAACSARPGVGNFDGRFRAGDLVISFPERWDGLERTVSRWPDEVEGVVSTAPCPPELLAALHERGLERMTEVYGSSETAGIGLRRWPETNYRLMPQWRALPAATEGEAAEGKATELEHISGARFRPMDRLDVREDGSFALAGRLDGAVQVGGVNVFPQRVAELLKTFPGVQEAVVRPMRPEEGSRLKAFVVPAPGVDGDGLRAGLEAWCAQRLASAERPKRFTLGAQLPRNAMGKWSDW